MANPADPDFYGEFGPPDNIPAPVSAYPEIAAAVRFLLTGDPESDTPGAVVIDYRARMAIRDIIRANPCTGTLNPLEITLTGADLEYFYEAAGYTVALSLLNTPAAAEYARTIVEVKIGPVTEKTQDGLIIETAKNWLTLEYEKALGNIACVAAGYSATNNLSLFGLAGARRAMEENCAAHRRLRLF